MHSPTIAISVTYKRDARAPARATTYNAYLSMHRAPRAHTYTRRLRLYVRGERGLDTESQLELVNWSSSRAAEGRCCASSGCAGRVR